MKKNKRYAVKRKLSLKRKLDFIDSTIITHVHNAFYQSRLRIELAMWKKGKAIELLKFRGVKVSNQPSYYQLEKETERSQPSLKQWHQLYLKYPDKKKYLPIAEEKADMWTKRVWKKINLNILGEENLLPAKPKKLVHTEAPTLLNYVEIMSEKGRYFCIELERIKDLVDEIRHPVIREAFMESMDKLCDVLKEIVAKGMSKPQKRIKPAKPPK